MERSNAVCIGRGAPIGDDGIWLFGRTEEEGEEENSDVSEEDGEETDEDEHELSQAFIQRQNLLVRHLHLFRQKGPTPH